MLSLYQSHLPWLIWFGAIDLYLLPVVPVLFFFIFSLLILAQVPASWGSYEKTNFDPNN
jgi:hypothetical protein